MIAICAFLLPAKTYPETTEKESDQVPVFIAPEPGIPAERLGAGTRSTEQDLAGPLYLLIPPGGGYTSLAKPPLVWRVTEGFEGVIRAKLEPVGGVGLQFERSGAFAPGYYALDLARSGYDLDVGETYRFNVSMSSQNTTVARASAVIERISEQPTDPGRAGIWFDALAPLVSVGLSGRVRITDTENFNALLEAGSVEK